MKKIIIISMIVLTLCGCGSKENETNEYDAKVGEIQNLVESNKEMPKFSISVMGLIDDTITNEDLKNLKIYDFEVDVTAYDLDPNSDVYHEKWSGVKLSEVLAKKNIENYDSLDFKATGNLTVTYTKEEINDNLYLVFYRNEVLLSETEDTPIMLFAADLKNRFWVPSLTRIDVR